jgi:hypothetical protein
MTPSSTLRRLLAAAPVAVLLVGCANSERSEPSHLLWPGDRNAQEVPLPRKPATRAAARPARADASVRKASAEDGPAVAIAEKATPEEKHDTPPAPAPLPAPPARADAHPAAPPSAQAQPKALADANSGALSMLRKQPAEKGLATPVATPAPPSNVPPAPPAVVIKNAAPAASTTAAADRTTAPKTTAPAPAKEVTPPDEVGDTIIQAELHLRIGNIEAARKILEQHVRAAHPEAMAELGRTFDPIELAAILAPANAADSTRAAELYAEASKQGSKAAGLRLALLQHWLAQKHK